MTVRPFQKGDTVKLKPGTLAKYHHECPDGRQDNHQADIRAMLRPGENTGEVWLDQDLHGCMYWNQEDLELVNAVDDK